MNMGHKKTDINTNVARMAIRDTVDDLSHIRNLLMLIHMATEGQKTVESDAIAEAIGVALNSADACKDRLVSIGVAA